MATAVWDPSHRAPELRKPLSSTAKRAAGVGGATGGLSGTTGGAGGAWAIVVDGYAFGTETGSCVAHFTTAPTETMSAASRTADPPRARRLLDRSRREGGSLRCRPRVREGCVKYPELVTKVAPVMQLRALVVRNILHETICNTTHGRTARRSPNLVDSLGNLLATDWRCRKFDYGGLVTVYANAALKFTDRDAYNRYQAAFMEVFKRFSGTLLAADEAPQVVEGQWDRDKVVLMTFPNVAAFREWAESTDYQRIRKSSCRCRHSGGAGASAADTYLNVGRCGTAGSMHAAHAGTTA